MFLKLTQQIAEATAVSLILAQASAHRAAVWLRSSLPSVYVPNVLMEGKRP